MSKFVEKWLADEIDWLLKAYKREVLKQRRSNSFLCICIYCTAPLSPRKGRLRSSHGDDDDDDDDEEYI